MEEVGAGVRSIQLQLDPSMSTLVKVLLELLWNIEHHRRVSAVELPNAVASVGQLLDETELAKRFQLSRSPVREALIRLAAEGLVQTLRNRSSIVAPFDVAAIPAVANRTTATPA